MCLSLSKTNQKQHCARTCLMHAIHTLTISHIYLCPFDCATSIKNTQLERGTYKVMKHQLIPLYISDLLVILYVFQTVV